MMLLNDAASADTPNKQDGFRLGLPTLDAADTFAVMVKA